MIVEMTGLSCILDDKYILRNIIFSREEIILGYPVKFLCKIDCLGLCPKCGQNLNEKKCDCKNDH